MNAPSVGGVRGRDGDDSDERSQQEPQHADRQPNQAEPPPSAVSRRRGGSWLLTFSEFDASIDLRERQILFTVSAGLHPPSLLSCGLGFTLWTSMGESRI